MRTKCAPRDDHAADGRVCCWWPYIKLGWSPPPHPQGCSHSSEGPGDNANPGAGEFPEEQWGTIPEAGAHLTAGLVCQALRRPGRWLHSARRTAAGSTATQTIPIERKVHRFRTPFAPVAPLPPPRGRQGCWVESHRN